MSTKRRVRVAATLHTKRDEAEYVTGFLETAGLSVALAACSRRCNTRMQKSLAFKPSCQSFPKIAHQA
jgi:hypothetical protein